MKRDSTAYAASKPAYDKNDCSVRALAVALGVSYYAASAVFSAAGRGLTKGTSFETSAKVYEEWLGMVRIKEPEGWAIAEFIRLAPKGAFVLHRRGHAFAVVEGVLHDWADGRTEEKSRIVNVWRVTEESRKKMARMVGLLG